MGLDFSHCNAHWAYSGFNRFRERLAKQIGIDLNTMEGFCKDGLKWDAIIDPIALLLNHSDCDGKLTPEQCKKIASRLRQMIKLWDNDDYDKQQGLLLAEGMEEASRKGESLEFI